MGSYLMAAFRLIDGSFFLHYLGAVAYPKRSVQTGTSLRIWNRRSSMARGKCIPISFERQTHHDCWKGTDENQSTWEISLSEAVKNENGPAFRRDFET